jgi:hypothetical protein
MGVNHYVSEALSSWVGSYCHDKLIADPLVNSTNNFSLELSIRSGMLQRSTVRMLCVERQDDPEKSIVS